LLDWVRIGIHVDAKLKTTPKPQLNIQSN